MPMIQLGISQSSLTFNLRSRCIKSQIFPMLSSIVEVYGRPVCVMRTSSIIIKNRFTER